MVSYITRRQPLTAADAWVLESRVGEIKANVVVETLRKLVRHVERAAWAGAATLLLGGTALGWSDHNQQSDRLLAFQQARSNVSGTETETEAAPAADHSDWSVGRRAAWQRERASAELSVPLAVINIPELRIQAEIFPDTSDRSLDLGVGHIEGTAGLGDRGNVGLAGHRDGYFRRLTDVRPGHEIQVLTTDTVRTYRVESIRVVSPTATEVLDDTGDSVLTLVTCYPFYFLGTAPERFIVRATLVEPNYLSTRNNPLQRN